MASAPALPFQSVEIYMNEAPFVPLLLTCEHASNALPPGWQWPLADAWLTDTHWAIDLGAADLTRALIDGYGGTAVLARFSRLFVDTNRDLNSETLFRSVADGLPVHLNQKLSAEERRKRLELCYHPYHQALRRQGRSRVGEVLVSIHSFTPVYEGNKREVEVGVMHVDQDDYAKAWVAKFEELGLVARENEPYSGKDGLMFCAHAHATANGRRAIGLEFRQDLLLHEFPRILAATGQVLEALVLSGPFAEADA